MSGRPTMRDSRRLPGPNLITSVPGAVIDIAAEGREADTAIQEWKKNARLILDAVGWTSETTAVRRFGDGASLVVTAPVDALYAATEVNEWAWEATIAELASEESPSVAAAADRLRGIIEEERNAPLLAMRDAAREHDVAFLTDDDHVTIGMGIGSRTWGSRGVPHPNAVDWKAVHDIPVALVTGSNGKTTTVRLLDAIARSAGRVSGMTSTDGIYVGGELVDAGDWSGPGGGRAVLRDTRVEVGILETARGGVLRRGLGVDRADAAIVTNAAADHLGEWGVEDVGAIADAKLVVRRALGRDGVLVLNADDETLAERGTALDVPVTWMSLDPNHMLLKQAAKERRPSYTVREGAFVRWSDDKLEQVLPVADAPITIGGAARYNVQNVLGTIAIATALGFEDEHIRSGVRAFSGSAEQNPGRGNFYEFGGARVVVDFAHNPHGMDALVDTVRRIPARRRLVLIGQAGDRDNASIRALARSMWELKPDLVIIKEMRKYLRGRTEGEVPRIIEDELRSSGASADQLERADTEWQGVRRALEWAQPDDLIFLPIHADRALVLALMERLRLTKWQPGDPVPARD